MALTRKIKECKQNITCPNCGPNGGDGEAFPAGIYVLNMPRISLDFRAALAAILFFKPERRKSEYFIH